MKKGNITQILDYYMSQDNLWMFRAEVDRALADFFEGEKSRSLSGDVAGHFNEWFLYDFHLSMGKTPLEYFCEKNPLRLNPDELAEYESIKENIYSLWEVWDVRKNKGLTLIDARSDEKYEVMEKSATFELEKGDAIMCRLIVVGNHWEIAGGSSFLIPKSEKNSKKIVKEFKKIPGEISPMNIYHVFFKKQQEQSFKKDKIAGSEEDVLLSGSFDGSPVQEDDNCAVCQLMKKTQKEGRKPTKKELADAMKEANQNSKGVK